MRLVLPFLLAASLSACATTGNRAALDPQDPYEGFNRNVWAFNQALDKAAIKPATKVYRTVTPVPTRRGLSRVLANLTEPFSAVNALLQGKPKRAFNSLGRFLINTTIGVGGLADHATDLGLPETREDFGQTLAQWGAKESPYLVLPVFGPSTVRDGVGTAVRFVADPASIVLNSELSGTQEAAVTGLKVIDARSRLIDTGVDSVLDQAADPYATARSAFLQRRRAELGDEASVSATGDDADEQLRKALEDETGQAVEPAQDSQPKQ
jgi:phospholipid-binding lipoprotein MlaA